MDDSFQSMIAGIDQGAEVTADKLSQMAMNLKQRQEQLFEIASDPKLKSLFTQYDDMLSEAGPQDLDALNEIILEINTLLQEKNMLLAEQDKLPELKLMDPQSLDDAQQQLYDATALAEGLQKAYAKIAQANAAEAAEGNFYSEQVAQLKDAFGAGDAAGLAKYVDKLNELYAANSDVTEGMLKMFPALGQIANGEMEAADAVEALNLMQLEAAKTARERTADMMEQAEAEQRLSQQQKQHYTGMLDELKKVFDAQGAAAFSTAFDELPEQAKSDIAKLYPEVARLAAGLLDAAGGAQVLADALQQAAQVDFSEYQKQLVDRYTQQAAQDEAGRAASGNFEHQLTALRFQAETNGIDGVRRALYAMQQTNGTLYES